MRCVVLCGAGRAFAAGADVAGLRALSAEEVLAGERGARWQRLRAARLPVIAAVHGWCLGGGCELALTCDIVLAAENARFGLPETGLGLIPGAGGTQRLPRVAGRSLALEVILGGRTLSAREALAARHLLARRGARGARARGAGARRAHRGAARARRAPGARGRAAGLRAPLEAGLREERRLFALAFASDDAREGMDAFVAQARAELEPQPMTEAPTHRVERDGAVATVTLDRPDALNAQTTRVARARSRATCARSRPTTAVRCVVLTGAGRAFCAGQDLREEGALENVDEVIRETYVPIVEALVGMPKPVVAAINGAAAGAGLSLALACDVRYMAEDAVLMMAFSNIALVPDCGGSWLLPRIVGYARAFELAASGRRVAADEALALGLVQRVLPGDELLPAAQATAAQLAARPTLALGWTKRLMRAAEQGSLADVMELEAQLQASAVALERSRARVSPRSSRSARRASRDADAVARPRLRLIVNPVASGVRGALGARRRCARSSRCCDVELVETERRGHAHRARGGGGRARLRRRRLDGRRRHGERGAERRRRRASRSACCRPEGRASCRARSACRGTSARPRAQVGGGARRRPRAPHQPRCGQRPALRVRVRGRRRRAGRAARRQRRAAARAAPGRRLLRGADHAHAAGAATSASRSSR